jgi:hypothetical protein
MTTLLIAYAAVSGVATVFVIFAGWRRSVRSGADSIEATSRAQAAR